MPKKKGTAAPVGPETARIGPFDLADCAAADTLDVVITDPRDLVVRPDTGLRVRILSIYSREAAASANESRVKLTLENGKVDAPTVDPSNWETTLFDQTVAVTTAWWDEHDEEDGVTHPGQIKVGGVWLDCTPANVRRVYGNPKYGWLQRQVQSAYLELRRFFPTPNPS